MHGVSVLISNWYFDLDPFGRGFVICLGIWFIVRIIIASYARWVTQNTDD